MTNEKRYDKIYKSQICGTNGGIAQLARAIGSYPIGHGFKSSFRYHFGPLVKRLRHGPFTAVTWVRFPYGSPKNTAEKYPFLQYFFIQVADLAYHRRRRIPLRLDDIQCLRIDDMPQRVADHIHAFGVIGMREYENLFNYLSKYDIIQKR